MLWTRRRRKQRRIRRRHAMSILFQPTSVMPKPANMYDLQWLAELCAQYWPDWMHAVDNYRNRLLRAMAADPTIPNIEALIPVDRLYGQMRQVMLS